jgi:hypothetical protein
MAAGGPEWPDRNAGRIEWSSPPLFFEVQRFRDLWWWKILAVLAAVATLGPSLAVLLHAIAVGGQANGRPVLPLPALVPLATGLLAGLAALYVLLWMRLETEVVDTGIRVRFRPFHLKPKLYSFGDIASAEAVTYSPLRDYGGWGIRYGRKGWAYNVSGNRGVLLKFRDRGDLLIGSLKADEFAAVLRGRIRGGGTA